MNRVLLCLLIACAITPLELSAQQQREQLQRAQSYSWYVRALRGDSIIATGRVRRVTDEAVRIETTELFYAELTTIERRKQVGGGALSGAAIGTASMSLIFASTGGGFEGLELIASVLAGALVGAPLGSVVGGVLVPRKDEWQTIWRAGI